ncbi:MAG: ubiquinone/menaquinone biosynthesis methyltransferase [Ignavibacteria bacterium]|nr:ubiquinone/menaquinone biosynthesis methyltransferase [Ignavibacteria bacterium]
MNSDLSSHKKELVKNMFNAIHETYDLLNHLLSFGVDIYWRKKALKKIFIQEDAICLDLASGTGDFGIEVYKKFECKVIAYDLALNSLKVFQKKITKIKLDKKNFLMVNGEAELLGIKSASIKMVTIAFGIRNFYNTEKSLSEIYRVLKSGGILNILEFSLPKNIFIRKLYLFYFNKILPKIGKLISSDKSAYNYLPSSVDKFEKEKDLISEFIKVGFDSIEVKNFTFGVVKNYKAIK